MVRRRWLTASFLLLALAGVGAELLLPILIRDAYRGASLPVLNRLIVGQQAHPLEHYLALGRSAGREILAALGLLWLALAVLSHPAVANRLAARLSVPENPPRPTLVLPTRGRRRIVTAVAVFVTAGSIGEMLVDPPWRGEHWPFSPYQMYSEMPRETLVARRLYGVISGGGGRELPLSEDAYVRPFDHSRLWSSWDVLDRSPDRQRRMPVALKDCLDRYESRRLRKEHDGPPLDAVRLYRVFWADPRYPARKVPARELLWEVCASTRNAPSR